MQLDKFGWKYSQAIAGDQDAIDYMYDYVEQNIRYANQLLYKLERENLINHTYKTTKTFLTEELGQTSPRFRKSTLTNENVMDVAAEMHRFLSTKTSRVGAARARMAQQQENLRLMREAGWNIPTDAEQLARINNILADGFYYSLDKKFKYQIMDAVEQALESGMDDSEIQKQFLRYASGEIVYDEFEEILGVLR